MNVRACTLITPTFPFAVSSTIEPLPGAPVGIIHRPQQARLRVDEGDDFLLVPDVIAGRDDGDARAQEIDRDLRRDAPAARRVFAVDDDEVDRVRFLQARQAARSRRCGPARPQRRPEKESSASREHRIEQPEIQTVIFRHFHRGSSSSSSSPSFLCAPAASRPTTSAIPWPIRRTGRRWRNIKERSRTMNSSGCCEMFIATHGISEEFIRDRSRFRAASSWTGTRRPGSRSASPRTSGDATGRGRSWRTAQSLARAETSGRSLRD